MLARRTPSTAGAMRYVKTNERKTMTRTPIAAKYSYATARTSSVVRAVTVTM